jgi:hypothetical protein
MGAVILLIVGIAMLLHQELCQEPSLVTYAYNPSTWEAEPEGL